MMKNPFRKKETDADRRVREGDSRPGASDSSGAFAEGFAGALARARDLPPSVVTHSVAHGPRSTCGGPGVCALCTAYSSGAVRANPGYPINGPFNPWSRSIRPEQRPDPRPRVIEEVEEPIKAWKQAKIGLDPVTHQVRFEGINSRTFYDVTDYARCNKRQPEAMVSFGVGQYAIDAAGFEGATLNHWSAWMEEGKLPEKPKPPKHEEPVLGCSCGFYSLKDRPRSVPGLVTLEVEHYGRILQHRLGYRAEFQRVLAVHFMAGQGVNVCSGPHHVRRDVEDFVFGSPASVRRSMGYGAPERQSTHVEVGEDGRIRNFMCFDCAKRELELASAQIWLKDPAMRAEFFDDYKQSLAPTAPIDWEFRPRKFMIASEVLPNFIGTDWVLDSAPYPWTATF